MLLGASVWDLLETEQGGVIGWLSGQALPGRWAMDPTIPAPGGLGLSLSRGSLWC